MVGEPGIEPGISRARGVRLSTRLLPDGRDGGTRTHDMLAPKASAIAARRHPVFEGGDVGVEPTLREPQSRVQSRYTNRPIGSGGWT